MQTHIVYQLLFQTRYNISKIGIPLSVLEIYTLSTDCKHMKMVSVFICAVKTSICHIHRGPSESYHMIPLLICAALNFRHSILPASASRTAYFNHATFPLTTAFFSHHLTPRATVIAWISEALGQLKIAELVIARAETSV